MMYHVAISQQFACATPQLRHLALSARPPFTTLAASAEFCIGSPQDPEDCESVQFVSGMATVPAVTASGGGPAPNASAGAPSSLMLTYGVNDCEARVGTLPLAKVWAMLRPLPPLADADGKSEDDEGMRRACWGSTL